MKPLYDDLDKQVKERFKVLKRKIEQISKEFYMSFLDKRFAILEERFRGETFKNFYEFQHEFGKIRIEFEVRSDIVCRANESSNRKIHQRLPTKRLLGKNSQKKLTLSLPSISRENQKMKS